MTLRVAMSGTGNMGGQIMAAVDAADDLELIGALDKLGEGSEVELANARRVPLSTDAAALGDWAPDVVIDFSNAAWTEELLPAAIEAGVHPVVGTSGISDELVEQARVRCAERDFGGVVAANFALGAVMMMHLARVAAPFFDAVEVIEQHHDGKVDSPSGTAMATARMMREARGSDFGRNVSERETLPNARGSESGGVTLHAVRLTGLVAHQVVIFGGTGETLTLRHDSISRESFIPEILRATRAAPDLDRLVVGLDELLGLSA